MYKQVTLVSSRVINLDHFWRQRIKELLLLQIHLEHFHLNSYTASPNGLVQLKIQGHILRWSKLVQLYWRQKGCANLGGPGWDSFKEEMLKIEDVTGRCCRWIAIFIVFLPGLCISICLFLFCSWHTLLCRFSLLPRILWKMHNLREALLNCSFLQTAQIQNGFGGSTCCIWKVARISIFGECFCKR